MEKVFWLEEGTCTFKTRYYPRGSGRPSFPVKRALCKGTGFSDDGNQYHTTADRMLKTGPETTDNRSVSNSGQKKEGTSDAVTLSLRSHLLSRGQLSKGKDNTKYKGMVERKEESRQFS